MSVRNPEDWLPEFGLSEMDCTKASVNMARFCVLALADPSVDRQEFGQMLGSFVYAAELSSREGQLERVIKTDLKIAGLDDESAASMAEALSEQNYLESVAAGDFINADLPEYGLRKTKKFTGVNERKFVQKIIRMSR